MKLRKSLIIGGLTVMFGLAAFAGVSSVSENRPVEKASALSNTGAAGDYIFFTPSSNWSQASASFRLSTYTNSGNTVQESSVMMSLLTEDVFGGKFTTETVYYYKTTKSFTHVQFHRYNPDGSSYWNDQSGKCAVSGSKHWVDMGTSDWWSTWTTSDSSGVSWKDTGDLTVLNTNCSTASHDTMRLFYYHKNTSWAANGKTALRAVGGDAANNNAGFEATRYFLTWFEDKDSSGTDEWYGYADIPTSFTNFKFVTCDNDQYGNSIWNWQRNSDIACANSSGKVYHAYQDGDGKTNVCISAGGAHGDTARTTLMQHVISAFDTCNTGRENGYSAYTDLNNYFYSHATATAKNASATSLGGFSTTIKAHFEGMKESYDGTRKRSSAIIVDPTNYGTDTTALATALASVAALAAVGGFFFLKKKRISIK